jgi:iron-sulfur cluster insertion protein
MITMTELAAQKALAAREAGGSTQPLRIKVIGGGCSGFTYDMTFDDYKPGDVEFEFYGLPVVIDSMSAMYLEGLEVSYSETLMAQGFELKNPGVKSTCGCGKSVQF